MVRILLRGPNECLPTHPEGVHPLALALAGTSPGASLLKRRSVLALGNSGEVNNKVDAIDAGTNFVSR
jgi:hypothetical protein